LIQTLFIVGLIILMNSCGKLPPDSPPPDWSFFDQDLLDGTWHLTSSTDIDSQGHISRYIGSSGDTILFPWHWDSNTNVVANTILSYVGGTGNYVTYNYNIFWVQTPRVSDIICNPPWKPNYSDTLVVTSYSEHLLVFRVAHTNDSGLEIDSLSKIRFY
jgi:hypothetical protein